MFQPIVACAVILLMGVWTLRTVGFTIQPHKDEREACQITRTKVKKRKKREICGHGTLPKMTCKERSVNLELSSPDDFFLFCWAWVLVN